MYGFWANNLELFSWTGFSFNRSKTFRNFLAKRNVCGRCDFHYQRLFHLGAIHKRRHLLRGRGIFGIHVSKNDVSKFVNENWIQDWLINKFHCFLWPFCKHYFSFSSLLTRPLTLTRSNPSDLWKKIPQRDWDL